jgi:hypothetical protein
MDLANDIRVDAHPPARPFQFSLRSMFVVTTMVAVVCGGLFAPWEWLQDFTAYYLGITVPMAVIVALIYSRGYLRTFWIGAAFPTGLLFLYLATETDLPKSFKALTLDVVEYNDPYLTNLTRGLAILVATLVVVTTGLIAMGVRWVVESPQRTHAR